MISPRTTGGNVVKCFTLEIGFASIQSRLAQETVTDGCEPWADFYTTGELTSARNKGGKGKKAAKRREVALESAFHSVQVGTL
jgi:hypothetical protein